MNSLGFRSFAYENGKNAIRKTLGNLNLITKSFWSFISNKCKNNRLPSSVFLNGVESEEGEEITNMFASHFKSFYTISNPEFPPIKPGPPIELSNIAITEEELISAIKEINVTAGPGPDLISASIISIYSVDLVDPLLWIFNTSLQKGIFPER